MNIELTIRDTGGHFSAIEQGEAIGKLTFSLPGTGKMILESTKVDPKFEGRGVGKQLVIAAVEYAREKEFAVIPSCPFARKVIDRDESLQDVLDVQVP